VLANCRSLADALAEYRRDITLLEPGFDDPVPPRPCPRDLARLPRPIVGYAGNLSDRVDVPLLRFVAERHPEWSVVLIGSAHGGSAVDALADLPNVHRLGVRPYPRVRDYVRGFDVALVPHADTPLSRTMAPIKVGLYCAEGVPVVATKVANLGALEEVIDVAGDPAAFVAAIERALAAPIAPERARRRAEILMAGTWSRRAERVIALLDAAWERRTLRVPS
jgi:glycosyltransferase involved in cell wall biosynthesis